MAYDKIIYPTTFDGVVELPTNVYRLGKVYYCTSHDYRNYTSLAGGAGVKIDIEQIKNKDIIYLNTDLTRPTLKRPVYVRLNESNIRVYPHAHSIYFDGNMGPAQYYTWGDTHNVTLTNGSNQVDYVGESGQDGEYIEKIYEYSYHYPKVSGIGIPNDTYITSIDTSNKTFTLSNSATYSGTIYMNVASANVKCDYIRSPLTPNWAYTEVNGAALYNSSNSIDFELHSSEETHLVARILSLAGATLKDNNVIQIGAAEEGKIIQSMQEFADYIDIIQIIQHLILIIILFHAISA